MKNENYLYRMKKKINENIYECIVKNSEEKEFEKVVFFKLSGILDPFKYMAGKYSINDQLFTLPKLNNNNAHDKVLDNNNSSYVDSFFSFYKDNFHYSSLYYYNYFHSMKRIYYKLVHNFVN